MITSVQLNKLTFIDFFTCISINISYRILVLLSISYLLKIQRFVCEMTLF